MASQPKEGRNDVRLDAKPLGFRVQEHPCNQCLFSTARIVDQERSDAIVKGCLDTDRYFICHKDRKHGNHGACCRGFWDRYKNHFLAGRLAQLLEIVKFVRIK